MNELHEAITNGELEEVTPLLNDPGAVNQPHSETGEYPLFIAAFNEFDDILYSLLDHGAAIPKPGTSTDSTPHQAFQYYFTSAYLRLNPRRRDHDDSETHPDNNAAESDINLALDSLNLIENKTDQDYRHLAGAYILFDSIYHTRNMPEKAVEYLHYAIGSYKQIKSWNSLDHEMMSLIYHLCATRYKTLFMREEASDCYRLSIEHILNTSNIPLIQVSLRITYSAWMDLYLYGTPGQKLCAIGLSLTIRMAKPSGLIRLLCEMTDEESLEKNFLFVTPMTQLLKILLNSDQLGLPLTREMTSFLRNKETYHKIERVIRILENHPFLIKDELTDRSDNKLLNCIFSLRQLNYELQHLSHKLERTATLMTDDMLFATKPSAPTEQQQAQNSGKLKLRHH